MPITNKDANLYSHQNVFLHVSPFVYAEMNQEVRLMLSAFLNFTIVYNCKHLLDNDIGVPNGTKIVSIEEGKSLQTNAENNPIYSRLKIKTLIFKRLL